MSATGAALAAGLQRALRPRARSDLASAQGSAGRIGRTAPQPRLRLGRRRLPSAAARAVDPKDRVEVWAAIEDGIDRLGRDPDARAAGVRARAAARPWQRPRDEVSRRCQLPRRTRCRRRATAIAARIAARFRHPDAFVNLAAIARASRAARRSARRADGGRDDRARRRRCVESPRDCSRPAAAPRTQRAARSPARSPRSRDAPNRTTTSAIIERRAGNEAAAQARLAGSAGPQSCVSGSAHELGTGYLLARQPGPRAEGLSGRARRRAPTMPRRSSARHAPRSIWGGRTRRGATTNGFVQVAPPEYRQQVCSQREAKRAPCRLERRTAEAAAPSRATASRPSPALPCPTPAAR